MEHPTTTDLAALEADVAALEAEGAAQDIRLAALLAPSAPAPTVRQQLNALWAGVAAASRELDQIEREQAALADAIAVLERDD